MRRAGRLRALAELALDPELDPEAARRETSRCLAEGGGDRRAARRPVEQLFGEEIVAIFGVPVAHEDDALRAARAAFRLREAIAPDRASGSGDGRARRGRQVVDRWRRHRRQAGEGGLLAGEILLGPKLRALAGRAVEADGARLLSLVEGARSLPLRLDTPFVGRHAELEALQLAVREAYAAKSFAISSSSVETRASARAGSRPGSPRRSRARPAC